MEFILKNIVGRGLCVQNAMDRLIMKGKLNSEIYLYRLDLACLRILRNKEKWIYLKFYAAKNCSMLNLPNYSMQCILNVH